jgi:hypothetical protein
MGDGQNDAVRIDSVRQIKLKFHSLTVASDAEFLAYP